MEFNPYQFRAQKLPLLYKNFEDAIDSIKEAIQDEKEDEFFYNYLISIAPTEEEKNIISNIRDDEIKHHKYLKEIYGFYLGNNLPTFKKDDLKVPKSYINGIRKAKFGELQAVKKYRDIIAGIPDVYYRDMLFEILTDELIHADKFDYILYLSLDNKVTTNLTNVLPEKTSFTTEEAIAIANELGIDFDKELFDVEQFRMGLDTELEHGKKYSPTNVTNNNPILTGKIALAHLREFPDYYTRLAKLEATAKQYWAKA